MPGYKAENMVAILPEPTPETKTLADRFEMPSLPTFTLVQYGMIGLVALYGMSVRKMNRPVLLTMVTGIALLHMYDHLYRVKRGPEHLFFLPQAKKEEYTCCGK